MKPPTVRTCPLCGHSFEVRADRAKCPQCLHGFHASRLDEPPTPPTLAADDVLHFTRILSREDDEVMQTVIQSIEDPREYLRSQRNRERLDFSDRFDWESPKDVDPFFAAHDALDRCEFIGTVDWRSFPDVVRDTAIPLFSREGVELDWSFIDEFVDDDAGVPPERILNIVAQKVSDLPSDLLLVCLCIPWDNYDFALVSKSEFGDLKRLGSPDFSVRRKF